MNRKTIFWATLMMLVVFSAYAGEQFDPEEDFSFEIIANGSAVKITGYVGTNTEVRIPQRIQGLPVTTIGDRAFAFNQLTNITIPDSVTHIGVGAFVENQLTSVEIGNGVTHIGNGVFAYNQITNIVIPDSVIHIGNYAFLYNQLTSVTIGNGVTHIGYWAFRGNQLTSVVIPDSVTHIGDFAFVNNRLTSAIIGNGVTHIGASAFSGSRFDLEIMEWVDEGGTLTSVTLGTSVTRIEYNAFRDNRIANIVIPDSVTAIGVNAFRNNQISTVIIPSNISIWWGAFQENPLTNIVLGANVELDSRYIVFDHEVQRFLRGNNVRAGTYTHNNGQWQFSFSKFAAVSGNRLASTVWESREDNTTIRFGETSFSFISVDRWGHSSSLAGFYTINGDLVTLNFGAAAVKSFGVEEIMGAIVGNSMTLTVFGVFNRIQ